MRIPAHYAPLSAGVSATPKNKKVPHRSTVIEIRQSDLGNNIFVLENTQSEGNIQRERSAIAA
jgi:hypothetical protein